MASAKQKAYTEASEECRRTDSEMLVLNEQPVVMGNASHVNLTFRCLDKENADAVRPTVRRGSLSGNYVGTVQDSIAGPGTMQATLVESDASLSGTLHITFPNPRHNNSGAIRGTISDATVMLTFTPSVPTSCPFTATLIQASAAQLTGTYAALHCQTAVSGTVALTRQEALAKPNAEALRIHEITIHCARWASLAESIAQARDRQAPLATEMPHILAEFRTIFSPELRAEDSSELERIEHEIRQLAANIYGTTHAPHTVRAEKEATCRAGLAGLYGIPQ